MRSPHVEARGLHQLWPQPTCLTSGPPSHALLQGHWTPWSRPSTVPPLGLCSQWCLYLECHFPFSPLSPHHISRLVETLPIFESTNAFCEGIPCPMVKMSPSGSLFYRHLEPCSIRDRRALGTIYTSISQSTSAVTHYKKSTPCCDPTHT